MAFFGMSFGPGRLLQLRPAAQHWLQDWKQGKAQAIQKMLLED